MAIPKRILGKTGVEVTVLGLGGVCWNLVDSDSEAINIVHYAIDRGITYLDTASSYKDSERRLGLALQERNRDSLFVATKCLARSGDAAKRELAASFENLQLDVIDLLQLHALDEAGSLDEVLGSDGTLRLIEEYQQAGKVRFIGLTGHTTPATFSRLVQEYEFDTILNPVGAVNRVWNDFIHTSITTARSQAMGIIGMKVMAYGQVPVEDRPLYVRFALSQDIDVAIIGMDTIDQVEENIRIAEQFTALSDIEEQEVLAKALALVPAAKKELWWLPQERLAS